MKGKPMATRSWVFLVAGLFLGASLQHAFATDAEPAGKVFEIRTYHTFPGRLNALHKRFREHTMKMFEKLGCPMSGTGCHRTIRPTRTLLSMSSRTPAANRPRR